MSFFSRLGGNNSEQLREQGRQLYKAGRIQEAFELFQKALAVATKHRDKKAEGWARHSIGLLLQDAGEISEAIKQFAQAIELGKQAGDDFLLTQDYGNLGTCYRLAGNLDQAAQCQQVSLDLAQRTNNPVQLASALHNLANVYAQQGKMDKAIPLYRRRVQIAEQLEDWRGVANSTLMLGRALLGIGAVGEANELLGTFANRHGNTPLPEDLIKSLMALRVECFKALEQSRPYGPQPAPRPAARTSANPLPKPPDVISQIPVVNTATRRDQVRALAEAGTKRIEEGDVAAGIRQFQSALEFARAGQLAEEEVITLCLLTDAYCKTGTPSKVLEYGNQALQMMRHHNLRNLEVSLLNVIGNGLAGSGQMQEALPFFEQSASMALQKDDQHSYGVALTNLGQVYMELNQPAEAVKLLGRALTVVQEIDDREGEMSILGSIGISYRIMKRPRDAAQALFQQLEIAEELEDVGVAAAANYNLANIYGDVGQYKEAVARAEYAAQLFGEVGDLMHRQQAYGTAQTYRAKL